MAQLGKVTDLGVVACKHCDAKYRKTAEHVGHRDEDQELCACGEVLERWKSTWLPTYTRLPD